MSRSSLTLLTLFAIAASSLAFAMVSPEIGPYHDGQEQVWPTVQKAPLCAVDANYPLRIVLSDEPAGFTRTPGANFSINYKIVAARQFESAEIELLPSTGVQILGGAGALQKEKLGILKRGESRFGTVTARLEPGQPRGTVEVRLIGWTEGLPLQTATVWNLLSEESSQLRSARTALSAGGTRVQEHQARRRVER